jgi:hypothetical protein
MVARIDARQERAQACHWQKRGRGLMRVPAMLMALSVSAILFAVPTLAQEGRLAEARRQCWIEVAGIHGNPSQTRGAMAYQDRVSACVRQKMSAQGQGQRQRR